MFIGEVSFILKPWFYFVFSFNFASFYKSMFNLTVALTT